MAISTIKSDNRKDFGTVVNLSGYTTSDFIAPKDGYLVANCSGASNAKAIGRIFGTNATISVGGWGNGTYATWSVPVKKGMKIKAITIENGGVLNYYPLID